MSLDSPSDLRYDETMNDSSDEMIECTECQNGRYGCSECHERIERLQVELEIWKDIAENRRREALAMERDAEKAEAERDKMRAALRDIRHRMDMAVIPGNDKMREIQGARVATEPFVETEGAR